MTVTKEELFDVFCKGTNQSLFGVVSARQDAITFLLNQAIYRTCDFLDCWEKDLDDFECDPGYLVIPNQELTLPLIECVGLGYESITYDIRDFLRPPYVGAGDFDEYDLEAFIAALDPAYTDLVIPPPQGQVVIDGFNLIYTPTVEGIFLMRIKVRTSEAVQITDNELRLTEQDINIRLEVDGPCLDCDDFQPIIEEFFDCTDFTPIIEEIFDEDDDIDFVNNCEGFQPYIEDIDNPGGGGGGNNNVNAGGNGNDN